MNSQIFKTLFFVIFLSSYGLHAQQCPAGGAAFINEFSGASIDEYIEIVVIGDPASPLDPVNLEGWILDDNNIAETGQGTASGHLVLGDCFSAMAPGSIIVVYNPDFPYPGIDPGFPNAAGSYVLPHSDPCISICTSNPSTFDESYMPCNSYGYEQWSDNLGLSTNGDGVQIRTPLAVFYHGLYYDTNFAPAGEPGCLDVGNIQSSLNCGDWFDVGNYASLTPSPGLANSVLNQALIDDIIAGTMDCDDIAASCNLFVCPTIDGLTAPDGICSGILFDVIATGLGDMSFADNTEENFGINFVLFDGSTEPADPYSGGTSIGIIDYNDLTGSDPNQEASLNTSLTDEGTYQICAILNPASDNPDCTPYFCKTIEVYSNPSAELSGLVDFCPDDCYIIDAQISGGTEPYEMTFEISVGAFSLPFTIPAYDLLDQPTICYIESGPLPTWDFATNTLIIPTLYTGTATITIFELTDANGCAPSSIDPNFLTINLNDSPEINSIDPLEECDEDNDGAAFFDLISLESTLNGGSGITVEWYEDSDGNITIVNPSNFFSASTIVYASLYDPNCPSDTIPVELIVTEIAYAGEDAEVEVCNQGNTTLDFEILVGGESGGEWTDESGSGVDLNDPTNVDFTDVDPGSYLFAYTISATDVCPRAEAFLTVIVIDPPNAGMDNDIGVCQGSPNLIDLFDLLGDNVILTGEWLDVNETGVDLTNPNAVDFSQIGLGVYTFEYTILSTNNCGDQTATIAVIIYEEPNPGLDNDLIICNAGNTLADLESALGPHDLTGIWVDENFSGVDLNNPYEVDFANIPAGSYEFTYAIPGSDSCPEASAVIIVEVFEPLFAGQDSTITLCEGASSNFDLFELLFGESNDQGNWSQLSGGNLDLSNPNSLNIINAQVGVDSFLYEMESQCGIDSAFVLFNIIEGPSAGSDKYISTCPAPDTFNLNTILATFDPDGNWYDAFDVVVSDPDTVFLNSSGLYSFYYIIPATADCASDTSLVQINLSDQTFAGADSSIFVCQGFNWTQNLFDLIPGVFDSTGVWTQLSGNPKDLTSPDSVLFENTIPETDSFLYVLNTVCGLDSAYAIITIDDASSAGDDYVVEICSNGPPVNLFDSLGNYSAGGNWLDQNGLVISDPSNHFPNTPGTFIYSYVIPQNGTCQADTALAQINIETAPDAGIDSIIFICEGINTSLNLLDLLGGQPMNNGVWSDLDNTGINLLDGQNIDFINLGFGQYDFLYTIASDPLGICLSDSSILTISIISAPNPGNDNYVSYCSDGIDLIVDLVVLLSDHDTNGSWSDDQTTGVDLSDPSNVDFSGIDPGLYPFTYSIAPTSSCPGDQAEILIELFEAPDAGNGNFIEVCEGYADLFDMFSLLENGISTTGSWNDPANSGLNLSNPAQIDLSSLGFGNYPFEYMVDGAGPCINDTSLYLINVLAAPFTGTCDTTLVCNGPSSSELNFENILIGNDAGGSYRELTSSGIDLSDPLMVDFEGLLEGRYIFEYFFPASGGCPEKSTRIYVDVTPAYEISFDRKICPDQSFSIGTGTYDLSNPTGTEYLNTIYGCDSIININLEADVIDATTVLTDANCFGTGSILIESVSGAELPVFIENNQLGIIEVQTLPFLIDPVDPGNYLLNFTDNRSCEDNLNVIIQSFSGFNIELPDEVSIKTGDSYQIQPETDLTPVSIAWWPETNLDCNNCLNPVATPKEDTEYILTLIDADGCMLTDTIMIRVAIETNVYVPNAFSPNGDALNQFFYVKSNSTLGTYTMRIFNRWGENLFLGENLILNQANIGWDGTYKGKSTNPGVYVYLIEILFDDGSIQTIGGDILLIR